jgi:hypothetical protein
MTKPTDLSGDTPLVGHFPTATKPVHYVVEAGEVYASFKDVCTVLGVLSPAAMYGDEALTMREFPQLSHAVPISTVEEFIAGMNRDDPRDEVFVTWLRGLKPKSARQKKGPNASRWGWQPIRDVVKSHNLSGRAFVDAANEVELTGVDTFSPGNYAAWSYGGCLPQESLVRRAEALFGVDRSKLFTEAVLNNMPYRGKGKRHPPKPNEEDETNDPG